MAPWQKKLSKNTEDTAVSSATAGSVYPMSTSTAPLADIRANETAMAVAKSTIDYSAPGPNPAASLGAPTEQKRKQASVVEMLEYVKGLDIDPIKEHDLLWIAEEAFNAPLPPFWTEHQDEQNRIYFHNTATGNSSWSHPMDDIFRDIVRYQRRVEQIAGFWEVEDEIAAFEENIRKELAEWMELYDESHEKFFYNRRTDESRFDDPRMAVYHGLYARIKMVAKMKERLPILARNTRPEEPSPQEIEFKAEEARYMKSVIKVQTMARVIAAKKRVKQRALQGTVQKGPQPLMGQMRLRMEKIGLGNHKELVLAMTTPHKRYKAATKIQARMRGILARKRFRPLVLHRTHLSRVVTGVQCLARQWLSRRVMKRLKEARKEKACVDIQRVYRGYVDRGYVSALRAERARFKLMVKNVVILQCFFRVCIAKAIYCQKKADRGRVFALKLQRQCRQYLARKLLHRFRMTEEPFQMVFNITKEPRAVGICPYSWELSMPPWALQPRGVEVEEGKFELMPEEKEAILKEEAEEPSWPVWKRIERLERDLAPKYPWIKGNRHVDLFEAQGSDYFRTHAAVVIQTRMRQCLAKKRVAFLKSLAEKCITFIFENTWRVIEIRRDAATKIQKVHRGGAVRSQRLIEKKYDAYLKKKSFEVEAIQSHAKRYLEQVWFLYISERGVQDKAATKIQAHFRRLMAQRHADALREDGLNLVKGWFEYMATGPDECQMNVGFVSNPFFDAYRFFLEFGHVGETLPEILTEMDTKVDRAVKGSDLVAHIREDVPIYSTSQSASLDTGASASSAAPLAGPLAGLKAKREAAERAKLQVPGKEGDSSGSRAPSPRAKEDKPKGDPLAAAKEAKAKKEEEARKRAEEKKAEAAKKKEEAEKKKADAAAKKAEEEAIKKAKEEEKRAEAAKKDEEKRAKAAEREAKAAEAADKRAAKAAEMESQKKAKEDKEKQMEADKEKKAKDQKKKEKEEQKTQKGPSSPGSGAFDFGDTKPKKKREPAERPPLFEESPPVAYARTVLRDAPTRYEDKFEPKSPGRSPKEGEGDEEGQPPPPTEKRAPAQPPAPGTGTKAEQAASRSRPPAGEVLADAAKTEKRKHYAGSFENGKFVKTKVVNLEEMSEADKQAILEDIEMARQEKMKQVANKSAAQKAKARKEKAAKTAKYSEKMEAFEAEEEDTRQKRVANLKKWLKRKEDERLDKAQQEAVMMQKLQEQEAQKQEMAKKAEEERLKERERRLRLAEKQKAKLEEQLLLSKQAAMGLAPQMSVDSMGSRRPSMMSKMHEASREPSVHSAYPGMQQLPMPGKLTPLPGMDPPGAEMTPKLKPLGLAPLPGGTQMPGQPPVFLQGGMPAGFPPGMSPMQQQQAQAQRVLHRHVHHHVHYHEGGEEGGQQRVVSTQEQRNLEDQCEARVKQQLDAQPPAEDAAYFAGAETPTMRKAASVGSMYPYGGMQSQQFQRTQQAFTRGPSLPQLGGVHGNFQRGMERAVVTYADTRRPRYAQQQAQRSHGF
eukprot:TRINITY_DN111313_c0_g1_i1.p1 TRINITY_DN111313_c0_g1~~TRINITY_DN111313_c0_g1_i1.p1  ORF type:complete len:1507 (+),score=590.76 TRINITY_DN111313_c0_g1_i1:138-4658(+)